MKHEASFELYPADNADEAVVRLGGSLSIDTVSRLHESPKELGPRHWLIVDLEDVH